MLKGLLVPLVYTKLISICSSCNTCCFF